MADIVPEVFDGDHLDADLLVLAGHGSTQPYVAMLEAFLDEVAESVDARWRLLERKAKTTKKPFLNCSAIECFHTAGYNIYRFRPFAASLKDFRIIYAYHHQRNEIHLLAACQKMPEPRPANPLPFQYDYAPNHPLSERIRIEYESRGFPKI